MPRYLIDRTFTWTGSDTIEVEAKNEDEADELAEDYDQFPTPLQWPEFHDECQLESMDTDITLIEEVANADA